MNNNILTMSLLFKNIAYATIGILNFVGGLALVIASLFMLTHVIGYIVVLSSSFLNIDPTVWALYNSTNSFFNITPTIATLNNTSYQNIGSGFLVFVLLSTSLITLFFLGMKDLGLKLLTKFSNK